LRTVYNTATNNAPITKPIIFTLQGNIGGTAAGSGNFALDTGGWPNGTDLTLIIPAISDNSSSPANGIVAGRGGPGGSGGQGPGQGTSGGDGGDAITINAAITIINYGIIGAGGGGGSGATGGVGAGVPIYNSNIGTPGTYRYGGVGCTSYYYNSNPGGNLGQPGKGSQATFDCGWWYGQISPGLPGWAITNLRQWPCTVRNRGSGVVIGTVDNSVVIINE